MLSIFENYRLYRSSNKNSNLIFLNKNLFYMFVNFNPFVKSLTIERSFVVRGLYLISG